MSPCFGVPILITDTPPICPIAWLDHIQIGVNYAKNTVFTIVDISISDRLRARPQPFARLHPSPLQMGSDRVR